MKDKNVNFEFEDEKEPFVLEQIKIHHTWI
jgi:hypothetical protein